MSVKFVSKFVHVKKIFFTNLHLQIYRHTKLEIKIDQLFVYLFFILLVLPVGVHMPHQRPPGQVIYGLIMTNWPRGF